MAVCLAMGLGRLAELAYSRRNLQRATTAREGPANRRTYPAMVMLHTAVIAGTAIRGGTRVHRMPLAALFAVQPIRLWVLGTLRDRWNTRGAVPGQMTVETGGPYRWVRHPNYGVVTVELAALPLAFGLARLAFVASVVNVALLWVRIRDEERALFRLPGYAEHFAPRKRFIPGLF